jgi:hypothetical protein
VATSASDDQEADAAHPEVIVRADTDVAMPVATVRRAQAERQVISHHLSVAVSDVDAARPLQIRRLDDGTDQAMAWHGVDTERTGV